MDRYDFEGINRCILEGPDRYDLTGMERYELEEMDQCNFEEHRICITGLLPGVHMGAVRAIFDCYGKTFDFRSWSIRGTAEVSYYCESYAIQAITETNDLNLGKFTIQTGWAKGWPRNRSTIRNFDQEFGESSPHNRTVFCGGFYSDAEFIDELLETIFSPFGTIVETVHWKDFALIQFAKKTDASLAISTIDGTLVNNFPVVCKWSCLEEEHIAERRLCTFGCGFSNPLTSTPYHSDVANSLELATPILSTKSSPSICLDKKIDVLFLPCAHLTSCSEFCTQEVEVCPVCRENYTYKIKAYYT